MSPSKILFNTFPLVSILGIIENNELVVFPSNTSFSCSVKNDTNIYTLNFNVGNIFVAELLDSIPGITRLESWHNISTHINS